ncbi:unnamed protein product [Orchesella dallaii]|uniref:PKS/mFAS DH domain-containing protein n=1 Tax=Orchesella dallaii TaxID=48710 RepID=A0ABP1S1A8_9HEXA
MHSQGKPRIAGVSSFGITGTDVHMILQEAPEMEDSDFQEVTPPLQILTLSGKTPEALEQVTNSIVSHLEMTSENITDIAFTSNACRTHHSLRRVVVGTDINEISTQILHQNYITGGSKLEKPKICFTFPGVIGSMNLDSPRELYRTSPVFRTNIDYCDSIFKKITGLSFSSILTQNWNASNPADERSKECYACFFAIQYSLFKLWESWNVKPDFVMGHCLGEIVTAVVAGVLRLEDGFNMILAVQHFSEANKQNPGAMLAIMCNQTAAEELIGSFLNEENSKIHWLDVASINSPTQTVIAGASETISEFASFCKDKGFRCKQVPVDFAIHSRAIDSALVKCENIASKLQHGSIKIPYISSVTGSLIQDKDLNEEYWYKCFRNAVQFTSACNTAVEEGCEIYIEIGLGPELSKLVEENVLDRTPASNFLSSFHKIGDKGWSGLLSSLAQLYVSGWEIDWEGFYRFYPKKKVSLPHYPFERKSFWFTRNKKGSYNRGNSDIKELHPLLGGFLSNAMECQIFQNFMSDLKAPYVFDHVIGSEVIFPAAGFLEMILSAGHFSACKNGLQNNIQDVSLQVEEFVIHHPLHLEPFVEKKMQTLLNSGGKGDQEDEITSRFTVHSHSEMDGWRLYASGVFTRLEHSSSAGGDLRSVIDTRDIKRTFQSKNDVTSKFYMEAAQVGLNFGPEFLSLNKVYQSEGETLAEVNIPEGSTSYICHPILIDAMIQCFILHTKPEFRKLHVPVQIGKFICHPSLFESRGNISNPVLNIYCKTETSGQTNAVYLVDDNGSVLCTMLQPQLAETTVEAVLAASGAVKPNDGTDMPNIYEIFWKHASCYQPKGSLNLAYNDLTDSPSFKNLLERMDKSNLFTGDENELDRNVNKLCYLYILKVLYDYGWKPEVGDSLRVDEVASEFKILPAFLPAFRHFVTYLIENGALDSDYVIKSLPESEENVTKNISTLRETLKGYEPVDIIHACGSQLAQVLQGNVTGQYILFGKEKDGENQAEIFYKTTRLHNGMFQAPAEVFNEISQQMWTNGRTNKSHDTLRILEVYSIYFTLPYLLCTYILHI